MALRNLAKILRIPTSAAARLPSPPTPAAFRLPSPPTVPPSAVSRLQSARDWYQFQRQRYDDVTTEFKNYRREVVWTERMTNLLDLVYKDAYKLESRRLIGTDACACCKHSRCGK